MAVVTSIYGGFDRPSSPPAQDVPCEWVLVTDQEIDCPPWQVVVEPRPQLHPRLAAKVAKARPDWYAEADVFIWVDGNLHIATGNFVRWCVAALGRAPLAQDLNPSRVSLLDEVAVAEPMAKYHDLPLRQQANHYLATGHPPDWGVWWTGLIVRSAACPNFGDAWLAEMTRWTYEDQVSEPYVLHQLGLRPKSLAINWADKPFGLAGHASDR